MLAMTFRAGIASTLITPTESMWMAGFAARREPSSGVETDLYAKALAIEDARGHRIVIVTADLIAVSREIADYVCGRLAKEAGLRREQILLTTSHTHCGPEVRPSKVPFFRIPEEFAKKIPGYVAKLQDKIVEVVLTALKSMEEVTLTTHETSAKFAGNRRGHEAWFDHSVPVLVVRKRVSGLGSRASGEVKAILFGYACHNTTLRPDFIRFCGDYAGFAQIELQKEFPGAQAMFIAGAGADQNPDPLGTLDIVKQHGTSLAKVVAEAVKSKGHEITGEIRAAFEDVPLEHLPLPTREKLQEDLKSEDLPVANKAKFLLEQLDAGHRLATTYPCPVHAVRFGHQLTLIAIGGEPVIDFAIDFKKKYLPGVPSSAGHEDRDKSPIVWVAGYANDMFGYVPTVRVQREGGYEGGRAMLWAALPCAFTETVEQRVKDAADRLVKSIT